MLLYICFILINICLCVFIFNIYIFTLVPRIQFYSIEIARNREGKNDKIREQFKKVDQLVEK